jgi:hypothetical protein
VAASCDLRPSNSVRYCDQLKKLKVRKTDVAMSKKLANDKI